ncbi:hypothetical protein [Tenacibaculum sp.]|uniref:hypothetical protein n=1 Tax=Tenacibaculum sp. TaxID=1906242 RepID=UPI003D0C6B7D
MKLNKETIKQFFERGDKPTQEQYADLIDSYVDSKQEAGEANRRFVIDETGEVSVASEQQVPEYTLSPISGTNTVDLLKDGISVSQIDLTPYLDNTNLARLVSGTVDANGVAIFTRDDNSIFTVDLSNLKDTVPQYQAGTNITIDNTDPLQPIINASGGESTDTSNLVPYTGATQDVDLGNHSINLGKLEENPDVNKNRVLLTYDNTPYFRLGTEVYNELDKNYTNDYYKSIGVGYEAIQSTIGSSNIGIGGRALKGSKGKYNVGVGFFSGEEIKGDYNLALGWQNSKNLKGSHNLMLGAKTGHFSYNDYNVGIGWYSMFLNTGRDNTGVGMNSLFGFNGSQNTAIGGANLNTINSQKVVSTDPSKRYVIEASDITSDGKITITNHGFTIGERKLFFYEPDSTDPTSQLLANIGARNPRISIWEAIDNNILQCLNETYFGTPVGRQIFTELEEINNSTSVGYDALFTKSNQVVLGDLSIEEVTTVGDYISTGIGKGLVLTTPDSTKQYRISIDNSGNIVTTLI